LKERRKTNKKKFETITIGILKKIIKFVEHLNNNKKCATIASILSVSERTQINV
jgi:hypothetical protein